MRAMTWGQAFPADFHTDEVDENPPQKWFRWTIHNDLAAKSYMNDDDQYLVRCRVCGTETYNTIAVWMHQDPACLKAIHIIAELTDDVEWVPEDGGWYDSRSKDHTSWSDTASPK